MPPSSRHSTPSLPGDCTLQLPVVQVSASQNSMLPAAAKPISAAVMTMNFIVSRGSRIKILKIGEGLGFVNEGGLLTVRAVGVCGVLSLTP